MTVGTPPDKHEVAVENYGRALGRFNHARDEYQRAKAALEQCDQELHRHGIHIEIPDTNNTKGGDHN